MSEGMPFDQFISAETNTDLLKMESVRQYHQAAVKAINEAPAFERKKEALGALDYSFQYISRCQATFVMMQKQISELELENSKLKKDEITLEAKRDELNNLIKDLKKWIK